MSESKTRRGRVGKIAHLSAEARDEINRRLFNGEVGRTLCAAVNDQFGLKGGAAITEKNLSEWRAGGYQDYLDERKDHRRHIDDMRVIADFSAEMAQAGVGVAEGAVAFAGGKIMGQIETMAPEKIAGVCKAIASLRGVEIDSLKARQKDRELAQRDRAQDQEDRKIRLQEEKVQIATAEALLRHAKSPEVQAIVNSKTTPKAVKVSSLRDIIYGNIGHGRQTKA